MIEREITERVSLTLPNGDLNPAALGWSRTPLHDTSGIGTGPLLRRRWGRNKRWEYWNVMTPTHILAITVSSIDYLALHSVWVYDRASSTAIDQTVISPGARSARLAPSLGESTATARTKSLRLDIEELPDRAGTRLTGVTERVSFDITAERPARHEALGVVVPWLRKGKTTRFQYTVKDVARPAKGLLRIDDAQVVVDTDAWAVLDHGRGRWPYSVWWNWAAGSGVVDGRVIGLQLGSKWTDGSGATENALLVDGRLTKLSEEYLWEYDRTDWMTPWRITGKTADLTFTPFYNKASRTNALVITTRTDQLFGVWSGWVLAHDGERVRVDGIEGWAEDVLNRW